MKPAFTLMLILLLASVNAQHTFSGRVLDDSTRTPLSKVNLYFPELRIGTLTAEDGSFRFENLPGGIFQLQATYVSYKTVTVRINTSGDENSFELLMKSSVIEFPEIVIYGSNNSNAEETANTISPISTREMREMGAINLSDGIAKLPGVSQLSTGAGISKPVIRGLYGNRIQTVMLGLRFDNQQWQDEHGLGLNDIGIDHVEVIKGAASLLYGSEAMGGVINIIEEKPAPEGKTVGDVNLKYFSNTNGASLDAGVKGSGSKFNWRIRLGSESHADYKDGNNTRILNSRYGGYFAKASFGWHSKNWICNNHYFFSFANFGFLMDTIQLFDPPDGRNSRSFDRPHHTVFLNIFSSQNTFFLKKSKVLLNLGVQSNNRQEQEGGNKISLDMMMNTFTGNAIWVRALSEKTELSIGTQDFFQTNKNFGSRVIIPDAHVFESSVYSYLRRNEKHITFEGGIRYDLRNIVSLTTNGLNINNTGPGSEIVPFNRIYSSLNGSAGISLFDKKHWNFKSNLSSGYRSANLAELSSNGLHEGTVRYEIGNIDLKVEQNFCADVLVAFSTKHFTLNGSAYYNQFNNYIYLAPTGTEYLGFQIFRYMQQDATLKGIEAVLNIHPEKLKWLNWSNNYSVVIGSTASGEYLPFIPAGKFNSDLKLLFGKTEKLSEVYVRPGITYVLSQNHPGVFETTTGNYYLFNASAGCVVSGEKIKYRLSVSGNNLLNNVYYDHLSRFKYFGVYNQGRNISINLNLTFK